MMKVPVVIKEVDYPRKLTKMSHRQRKQQSPPVLECGNAAVVFQFEMCAILLQDIELWWEEEYKLKGEDFNVELFVDYGNMIIELRFYKELPFYTARGRHCDSVFDDIEANILGCYESLPQSFMEAVDGCYVSDWDYLEYADELLEENV